MKILTPGWALVFLGVFLMNLYIWKSYWKTPFKKMRAFKLSIYLVVQLTLALLTIYYFYLFFSARLEDRHRKLSQLAGFYISILHYSMLIYLVHDLVYFTRNYINYPIFLRKLGDRLFFGGFTIFILASILSFFAIRNSKGVHLKEYWIDAKAYDSGLNTLKIGYISDGHFGTSLNRSNISELVDLLDGLDLDLLLLGGDFYDEGTKEEDKLYLAKSLGAIRTRYGTYGVLGNHEYKSGDTDLGHFQDQGIRLLKDETLNLGSFYLIGRDDKLYSRKEFKDIDRREESLPTIILDHRPYYRDTWKEEFTVQVSGHTHGGQFLPLKLANKLVSLVKGEFIYGYNEKGDSKYIVSSGIGDFGVPIRLGSKREVVVVNVDFK